MQKIEGKGRRVLVVDDDRENVDLLTEYLTREGHTVTNASDGESALHRVRAWKPHLILCDINMPGISGIELIPKIRAATQDDYAAIVLVSANMGIDDVNKGLDAGADDYLTKPFRAQELLSRVRAMMRVKELQDTLRRASHRIEELSTLDDLTGLLNAKTIFRKGEDEIQRCRRFKRPISALLINLDRFSEVNESANFVFGSLLLKEVGAKIRQCVRSLDMISHIGADEYFVILPETDLAGAEFVAERIRETVQQAEFRQDKHIAKLTASLGISGFSGDRIEGGMLDLMHHASEALRTAKASGSNKIEIYSFV